MESSVACEGCHMSMTKVFSAMMQQMIIATMAMNLFWRKTSAFSTLDLRLERDTKRRKRRHQAKNASRAL